MYIAEKWYGYAWNFKITLNLEKGMHTLQSVHTSIENESPFLKYYNISRKAYG